MSHAPFSPSAAKRWMACPGSIKASIGRESQDSEHSRKGTFGHSIAAACLENDLDAAEKIGCTNGEHTVDAAMASAIQVYLDHVREIQFLAGGTLHVERKLTGWHQQCYGTADAVIVRSDGKRCVIDVFDLKLGAGVYVDVVENEQMLTYAVMAAEDAGWPRAAVAEVNLHIVQPLYTGAAPVRSWQTDGTRLKQHEDALRLAIANANVPKPMLQAGDHCTWCPAKKTCITLQKQALAVAADVFPNLDPTVSPKIPDVALYKPAELAKALRGADIVESWIKAIREQAFARASAGETVPGFKLVARIGNRKWADPTAAAVALKKCGIDPFEPAELKSPAAVEKMSKSLKPTVESLIVRPTTGVSLVPNSDKRPAIDPASAFALLSDSDD